MMNKMMKIVWVGVAAGIAWGVYNIGHSDGARSVKRYTIEEVKVPSQKTDPQGYEMTSGWTVHRIDGTIYQTDYAPLGKIQATEYGDEFNIAMNNGITGHIVRNGEQYDFYSAAGDKIGRLMPCRWSGNGNGWDIFTTTQGYVGHIDEHGDWILRLGCSLLIDLDTMHDFYIKNTKKFELPEGFLAGGDGCPHPVAK
jgi:hypothetical protein